MLALVLSGHVRPTADNRHYLFHTANIMCARPSHQSQLKTSPSTRESLSSETTTRCKNGQFMPQNKFNPEESSYSEAKSSSQVKSSSAFASPQPKTPLQETNKPLNTEVALMDKNNSKKHVHSIRSAHVSNHKADKTSTATITAVTATLAMFALATAINGKQDAKQTNKQTAQRINTQHKTAQCIQ